MPANFFVFLSGGPRHGDGNNPKRQPIFSCLFVLQKDTSEEVANVGRTTTTLKRKVFVCQSWDSLLHKGTDSRGRAIQEDDCKRSKITFFFRRILESIASIRLL
jgi:hypothetical protein